MNSIIMILIIVAAQHDTTIYKAYRFAYALCIAEGKEVEAEEIKKAYLIWEAEEKARFLENAKN